MGFLTCQGARACRDPSKTYLFDQFGCLRSILEQKNEKKAEVNFEYTFNRVLVHQIKRLIVIWNRVWVYYIAVKCA